MPLVRSMLIYQKTVVSYQKTKACCHFTLKMDNLHFIYNMAILCGNI